MRVHDEGTIDLDAVDRKTADVAERREPGTKVVNRNRYSGGAELAEHARCASVLQEHALGNLDFQTMRGQTAAAQRLEHVRNEVRAAHLPG